MAQESLLSTIWPWAIATATLAFVCIFQGLRNRILRRQQIELQQAVEACNTTKQRLVSEMQLVNLTHSLGNEISIDSAIPIILESAIKIAGASSGAIYLLNEAQQQAQVAAEFGIHDSMEKRINSHLMVASLPTEAFLAPSFYGTYKDFLFETCTPTHDKLNSIAFASAPIFNKHGTMLLLHLHYVEMKLFSDNDKEVIERFKNTVSNELSRIDALARMSQTLALAESQNSSTDTVLQNISFEIRTSLNSIVGASEVLKTLGLDTNQLTMISYMEQSTEELRAALSLMLEFASTNGSHLSIMQDNVDLRTLVKQVLSIFHHWAQAKNIALSFLMNQNVPYLVRTDATRLKQILVNLVGSAVRYTAQNQLRLDIKTEVSPYDKIVLKFCISDTGIGLSKSKLQSLFSLVEIAGGHHHDFSNSGGLALAITKRMVEFMGGEIGVEPADTLGSVFWFTIPADNVCNDGDDSANQEDHKKFIESFRTNKQEEIPDEDIWAQNDFLARLSGDSEVVKHLKSIFDSTTPEKLLQLRQATVRNDRLVCDNLSHELKGVAQNMQMPRLLQAIIMYREELLEKEKSSDILLQYFDLINEEFERARTVRL